MEAPATRYDAVGGMAFFERLVAAFHPRVERDPMAAPAVRNR